MSCYRSVALLAVCLAQVCAAAQPVESPPAARPAPPAPAIPADRPLTPAPPPAPASGQEPAPTPQPAPSAPAPMPEEQVPAVAPDKLETKAEFLEIIVVEGGSLLRFHCTAPKNAKLEIPIGRNNDSAQVLQSFRADQVVVEPDPKEVKPNPEGAKPNPVGIERSINSESGVLTLSHNQQDLNAYVTIKLNRMTGTTVYEIHEEQRMVRVILALTNATGQPFDGGESLQLTCDGHTATLEDFSIGTPPYDEASVVEVELTKSSFGESDLGYLMTSDELRRVPCVAKFRFLSEKWPPQFSKVRPIRVTRPGRSYDLTAIASASDFARVRKAQFIEIETDEIPPIPVSSEPAYKKFQGGVLGSDEASVLNPGLYKWQAWWKDELSHQGTKPVFVFYLGHPAPVRIPTNGMKTTGPERESVPQTIRLLVDEIGRVDADGVRSKLKQVAYALDIALRAKSDDAPELTSIWLRTLVLHTDLSKVESEQKSLLNKLAAVPPPPGDHRAKLDALESLAQEMVEVWNRQVGLGVHELDLSSQGLAPDAVFLTVP